MTRNSIAALTAIGVAAMLMAGCRVEENRHGDGKDVKIVTPFGGMDVKTNDAAVLGSIALPAYPGAVAVNKDDDKDRSADVDMSFGDYKLRVKVASFRTDDSMDKVEAFYRDGLRRFGGAIACHDNKAVGSPAATAEGLTCDDKHVGQVNVNVDDSSTNHQLALKAGSEHHQHIVTIDPDGGGTKFTLVSLDLPGNISFGDDNGGEHRQ